MLMEYLKLLWEPLTNNNNNNNSNNNLNLSNLNSMEFLYNNNKDK